MSSTPKKDPSKKTPATPSRTTFRPRKPRPQPVDDVLEANPQERQRSESPEIVRSLHEEDPFTFIRKSPKPGRNPTKKGKVDYVPNLRENAPTPRYRLDELEGDQSPVALRNQRSTAKKEKARQNEGELKVEETPIRRISSREPKPKPPQEDPLAEMWQEKSEVEVSPNSSGGKDYVPSPKSSEKSPVAILQPEEPAKVKANAKVKREQITLVIPPGQKSHSKAKGKSDSGVKKQRRKPKKRAHADRIFRGGRAIPRGGVDIPLRRSARIQEKAEKNEQN
ncbi:hypothetical protein RUND412_009497 [Rhizina undulata]